MNICKKEAKNKILTIPNLMSAFRLLLIPLLIWLYCGKKDDTSTAIVLVVSGLTDIADGFIARRFNMVSDVGKVLDPVADKLTQMAVLFCLLTRFQILIVPLATLVAKEIINGVMGIAVIKKTGLVLSAEWHGKLCTFLLYATMFLHLIWSNITPAVSTICAGICTCVMLISLALYIARNIKCIGYDRKK